MPLRHPSRSPIFYFTEKRGKGRRNRFRILEPEEVGGDEKSLNHETSIRGFDEAGVKSQIPLKGHCGAARESTLKEKKKGQSASTRP